MIAPDFRYTDRYTDIYGGGVSSVLTAQILGGDVPVRADSFAYTLIDRDGKNIGTLQPSVDSAPRVRFDTARTTMRTMDGLELYRTDLIAIDTEHERLRAEMILQNGARFALGTFLFGQDNQSPASWGVKATPEFFDRAFLLDQGLAATVSLRAGQSVQGLVYRLLLPYAITAVFDCLDVETTTPLVFPPGSSTYAALKVCADLLGCFAPFFDALDVLRFRTPRAAGDTTVDRTYSSGSTIVEETVQLSAWLFQATNRWIVVGDGRVAPVVGVYDLPASAPHSAANRDGKVVTKTRTVSGVTSSSMAQHLAWMDAITDRTAYGKVTFDSLADPRHDAFDTLLVLGTRYLETAWEIECSSGGAHRHEGAELWPV